MQPEISFHKNKLPQEKFLLTFLLVLFLGQAGGRAGGQAGSTRNFAHAVREMILVVGCNCLKLHSVVQFVLGLACL
jgi:hypothetical protein